jgi:transcription-repair coupling factor (superfamily II helicase)
LYCQLLENAARQLRNEPVREAFHVAIDLPVSAFFPGSYIPAGRQKIELYRKLSALRTPEELQELRDESRDRFGPLPADAARLIEVRELQLFAGFWRIDDVHLEGKFAVFGYKNVPKIRRLAKLVGSDLRIVDERNAYLLLPRPQPAGDALLGHLKAVLLPR